MLYVTVTITVTDHVIAREKHRRFWKDDVI